MKKRLIILVLRLSSIMGRAPSHSNAFIPVCSQQDQARGGKNRGKNNSLLVAKSDHRHQSVTSSSPLYLFQQYHAACWTNGWRRFLCTFGWKGHHHKHKQDLIFFYGSCTNVRSIFKPNIGWDEQTSFCRKAPDFLKLVVKGSVGRELSGMDRQTNKRSRL